MPRLRLRFRNAKALAFVVAMVASLASAPPASGQQPRPTARAAPSVLARLVPARDLVFYVEFDGLNDHAAAWRKSAAYQILNRTKLGALLEDVGAQTFDAYLKDRAPGTPRGTAFVAFFEELFRSGFVFAVTRKGQEEPFTLLAVRRGVRPEVRGFLERLDIDRSGAKIERRTVRKGSRTIGLLGEGESAPAILDDQGDLIVCAAGAVDRVLAVLGGQESSALGNPTRIALSRTETGFDRLGLAFLDFTGTPPPPEMARLGWDGLKRFEYRLGFQSNALMSILRVIAPSPRRGVLALVDQPTFDKSSLPPLPSGVAGFTVISANPLRVYDQVVALMKAADPAASGRIAASEEARRKTLGLDLRKDLLAHMGSLWAVYTRTAGRTLAGMPSSYADLTISVPIDNAAKVARAIDPLVSAMNAQLAHSKANAQRPPGSAALQFRKLKGVRPSYALSVPAGMFPKGPMANLEPTLIVGKDRLILAGGIPAAEAAQVLAARTAGRWTPAGPYVPLAQQIPPGLVYLNINDPRETLPGLVANLPVIVQAFQSGMAQQAARPGTGGRAPAGVASPIRIDPDLVPAAGELARLLFPGSISVATDPQGFRVVVREAFPSGISPSSGSIAVALLLPAVQAAREAARKAQCINNLKQIGLAFHEYQAVHQVLPRAAIVDPGGKPLLSWRVALLPHLGMQDLYDQFKRDEPWDSPHNRPLLTAMPSVYACPSSPRGAPGLTSYRVFVGNGAFLETGRDVRLADIADGLDSTLAVVEAQDAVPWTKPDELAFDPEGAAPLLGAGSPHPGGFHALFADGFVRFLNAAISPRILRALVTRAGGEGVRPPSDEPGRRQPR